MLIHNAAIRAWDRCLWESLRTVPKTSFFRGTQHVCFQCRGQRLRSRWNPTCLFFMLREGRKGSRTFNICTYSASISARDQVGNQYFAFSVATRACEKGGWKTQTCRIDANLCNRIESAIEGETTSKILTRLIILPRSAPVLRHSGWGFDGFR